MLLLKSKHVYPADAFFCLGMKACGLSFGCDEMSICALSSHENFKKGKSHEIHILFSFNLS